MNLLSSTAILVPREPVQTTTEKEAPSISLEEILILPKVWDAKGEEKMKSALH